MVIFLVFLVAYTVAIPSLFSQNGAALPHYGLSAHPAWHTPLPKVLAEASGIACTTDGRVFMHNDEHGVLYHVDIYTGVILSSFSVGSPALRDDFEGLCIVGDTFYLSTSRGYIYSFAEGNNGESVPYTVYNTHLGKQYELEGLCYNPLTNALLLPVKQHQKKKKQNKRPIFSFSLATKTLDPEPYFTLQKSDIASSPHGEFNPSSIEYNPATTTFFLLAAQGHAVLELSPSGEILHQDAIDDQLFPQPEGLTFMPDGTLLLCSEADTAPRAILAGFRPHKGK